LFALRPSNPTSLRVSLDDAHQCLDALD